MVDSAFVAVVEELPDAEGTVDVAASGMEADATPGVDEDVPVVLLLVADVAIWAGVEVEETNGGAFSMYEPSGCTA